MSMNNSSSGLVELVADELMGMYKKVFSDDTIPMQDKMKRLEELSKQSLVDYEMQEVRKLLDDLYTCFGSVYKKQRKPKHFPRQSLFLYFREAIEPFQKLSIILDRACNSNNTDLVNAIVFLVCNWKGDKFPSRSLQDRAMTHCMDLLQINHRHQLDLCRYGSVSDMGVSHE